MDMQSRDIYINGRFLTQSLTGVQRVAYELLRSIDELVVSGTINVNNRNITILVPSQIRAWPQYSAIRILKVGKLQGHLWEQVELPFYARDGVLLNLGNTAPMFKRDQVVMIHDAAVYAAPGGFTRLFRMWYRILFFALTRRARTILTVSEFSKRELEKYARVTPGKVVVVPNGADHLGRIKADYSILEKHNLAKSRFILFVGSANPNKNTKVIFEALALLRLNDISAVIVGSDNSKVFGATRDDLASSAAVDVIAAGHISDEQLKGLYEKALCFVFPSKYEGFGLPPLEAMACGCPVVTSDAGAIPEVCADAVLYFDPADARSLSEALSRAASDGTLRERLRQKGYLRTGGYLWSRSAAAVWDEVSRF